MSSFEPAEVGLPPGVLIGLPDAARVDQWIHQAGGFGQPRPSQLIGRIVVRHHRPGVVEIVPDSDDVRPTDIDSLLEFLALLGRLYRARMSVVSRLPLHVLRRRLNRGIGTENGPSSGPDVIAVLLLRGITVVAPYPDGADLDEVAEAVGQAVIERYPGGELVLIQAPDGERRPIVVDYRFDEDGHDPASDDAPYTGAGDPMAGIDAGGIDAGGIGYGGIGYGGIDTGLTYEAVAPGGPAQAGAAGAPGRRGASSGPGESFAPPSGPGESHRRWLNVLVTGPSGEPVAAQLAARTDYLLRVNIGLPAAHNVIAGGRPFPADQLPHAQYGWRLDVVVAGTDVTMDRQARELILPVTGDSWTCGCGWRATSHRCTTAQRSAWLDIPFRSPADSGVTTVEIRVYYGAVLLQAAEVTLTVGGLAAVPPAGAITYCRDPGLVDLDQHVGRSLSCHLHARSAGRHLLTINNGQADPLYFECADEQTMRAASALRTVLYETHLDGDGNPRHGIGPGGQPVKSASEYADDLRRLAGVGALVYRALMLDSTEEQRLRQWLSDTAQATNAPAVIQIARSTNSRLSLPWQLLYEEPLIDGPSAAWLCHSVWEWGPGAAPAGDPPPRCPYEDQHDRFRGTICPFGFWGLAHVIECPPSTRTHLLPRLTSADGPPQLIAAVNGRLRQWGQHVERIANVTGAERLPVVTSWPQLRTQAADGSDVLYFFCHGRYQTVDGIPPEQPVLDLGDNSLITPDRLTAWATMTRWDRRQPLVVLNGCGTGEILPDLLSTFVESFVDSLHAAGVLATEITVETQAAQYAAEALLALLWRGHRAGAAVRALRWELLASGSVFGLAYTPHCDAFLGLPAAS